MRAATVARGHARTGDGRVLAASRALRASANHGSLEVASVEHLLLLRLQSRLADVIGDRVVTLEVGGGDVLGDAELERRCVGACRLGAVLLGGAVVAVRGTTRAHLGRVERLAEEVLARL